MIASILSDSFRREKVLSQRDASDVLREAFSQTEAFINHYYEVFFLINFQFAYFLYLFSVACISVRTLESTCGSHPSIFFSYLFVSSKCWFYLLPCFYWFYVMFVYWKVIIFSITFVSHKSIYFKWERNNKRFQLAQCFIDVSLQLENFK